MYKTDKLYSRDSNDNIRIWWAEVEQEFEGYLVTSKHGVLGGKIILSSYVVKEGKNIGRSNATTAEQQAINEAESSFKDKRRAGGKTLDDLTISHLADEKMLIRLLKLALPPYNTDLLDKAKPMKAQQYYKDFERTKIRIDFPCIGQAKINGVRCVASLDTTLPSKIQTTLDFSQDNVKLRTKSGLLFPYMEHIESQLSGIFEFNFGDTLDGELWYPKAKYLSDTTHAVNSRNELNKDVTFYIFDIAEPGIKQSLRTRTLAELAKETLQRDIESYPNIAFTLTEWIYSDEEAQKFTDMCISYGYEGAVFRNPDAFYEFGKRPRTMVKLKRFMDEEYPIIDIIPMKKYPTQGLYVCITPEGKEFSATPKMTHKEKEDLLTNKELYIGKNLTVRFYEYTKNNIPFHGIGLIIRDYE